MAQHNEFGKEAEKKAVQYLQSQHFKILQTNWFYQKAEIDIIAKKNNTIHIVEVKARSYNQVQNPEESVTTQKKKLLVEASNAYIEQKQLNYDVQFDIISILYEKNKWKINHILDAFNSVF